MKERLYLNIIGNKEYGYKIKRQLYKPYLGILEVERAIKKWNSLYKSLVQKNTHSIEKDVIIKSIRRKSNG